MNEPHSPTQQQRDMVEAMAGFGIPQDDIALVLKIDPKTLRLHYREELDRGVAVANTKVAKSLFEIATSKGQGAVTAAIFWLKCRAGWSEYAPAPAPTVPKERPLGKKEQAQLDAESADEGTGWGGLVN